METVDRMLATMRAAFSAMGRGQARWVERDGVGALVTPSVPNRSIVNCVIYTRGSDIAGSYDWLEEEFAEVHAWTVWVPEDDAAEIQDVAAAITYGWGMIPVAVTIGGTTWTTSLWPKDGRYVVPLKDRIRKAERIALDDVVTVRLRIEV